MTLKMSLLSENVLSIWKIKTLKATDGFDAGGIWFIWFDYRPSAKEELYGKCYAQEEKRGIKKVQDAIQHTLKITDKENLIVQHIAENTPENAVVFLAGVGKCFPLLQAPEVFNKILYNMPQAFASVPMVLFYPGTYTEQELIIF